MSILGTAENFHSTVTLCKDPKDVVLRLPIMTMMPGEAIKILIYAQGKGI
jgi:hypothetical protein